jgi:hypothetical protein
MRESQMIVIGIVLFISVFLSCPKQHPFWHVIIVNANALKVKDKTILTWDGPGTSYPPLQIRMYVLGSVPDAQEKM